MRLEHQALYRKYRPKTFEDVCGQDHITSVLKYESSHGTLSHAYLFCGPRGTGKTTCAKILAKAVNCESPVNGDPCGKCYKCKAIDDGSATDIVEMDAASNTGVDYIREIRDEVMYSPAIMRRRVYIIDEVHMLSAGAFNALLKTLEEPPAHAMFILATTEQHKIPATIISRCQRFDFRRITVSDIVSRLSYIANEENIPLDEAAAVLVAKQSQGCMRDAVSMFELCSGGGSDVTAERVREVLGISGIESACITADAIKRGDIGALFDIVDSVVSSSKDISVYWQELISLWRDMLVAKNVRDLEEYLDLTAGEAKLLRESADKFTSAELAYASGILDDTLMRMTRLPQIKRNIAELSLVRLASPALSADTDAMLARIAALEDRLTLLERQKRDAGVMPQSDIEISNDNRPSEAVPEVIRAEAEPREVAEDEVISPCGTEISDKSELLERIGSSDPMLRGFVSSSRITVSDGGRLITVFAENKFAEGILMRDGSKSTIADAMALCGYSEVGARVEIVLALEKDSQGSDLDEIDG